jgi:hypothetical protein
VTAAADVLTVMAAAGVLIVTEAAGGLTVTAAAGGLTGTTAAAGGLTGAGPTGTTTGGPLALSRRRTRTLRSRRRTIRLLSTLPSRSTRRTAVMPVTTSTGPAAEWELLSARSAVPGARNRSTAVARAGRTTAAAAGGSVHSPNSVCTAGGVRAAGSLRDPGRSLLSCACVSGRERVHTSSSSTAWLLRSPYLTGAGLLETLTTGVAAKYKSRECARPQNNFFS